MEVRVTESKNDSRAAGDEGGAFDNFLPANKEWTAFSAAVTITVAIAAYAYEWGYGDAIGFDVISATSALDRASEWRVLWPLALAIVFGRCLIPVRGDLSAYPEWVQKLRSSSLAYVSWVVLAFGGIFILSVFVPAFRETHPESGDDPPDVAAYATTFVLLMVSSSPIAQRKLAFAGRIGSYLAMLACAVLFAHYLGGKAGNAVLNRTDPVTLACLKADGSSAPIPLEIVRSFASGYVVRDGSGLFYWLKNKDAEGLRIAQPSAPGGWFNCGSS
jgi:hypothetical protein